MIFRETKLQGVFIVELQRIEDERGFFGRFFCRKEFSEQGLNPDVAQCSISFNRETGTLRGMHYQSAPHAEVKLVRCTRGKLYDVVVDLRKESPTFKQWIGQELSADNWQMLYIPEGCAHGFLTLTENTEIVYQISVFYHPESGCGVRWNDPAFGIEWPARSCMILSDRDRNWPDYPG
jgi:dTDP-4-dehydrorhamnose 3,5-epimerase